MKSCGRSFFKKKKDRRWNPSANENVETIVGCWFYFYFLEINKNGSKKTKKTHQNGEISEVNLYFFIFQKKLEWRLNWRLGSARGEINKNISKKIGKTPKKREIA